MRTEDKNKRCARGEYYITPQGKPEFSPADKKPFWEVHGHTLWGKRIRQRHDSWTAADLRVRELEDADGKWLTENKQFEQPAIIVSKVLDEMRLAQATRAIALLPLDHLKRADSRYLLDEGIEFALQAGWSPVHGNDTIQKLSDGYQELLKKRNKLKWQDQDSLADISLVSELLKQRYCAELFGKKTLATINSVEIQKQIVETCGASDPKKQGALEGLSRLLNHLAREGKIHIVRVYTSTAATAVRLSERMACLGWQTCLPAG